jgi:hypothetical protein
MSLDDATLRTGLSALGTSPLTLRPAYLALDLQVL